MEELCSSGVEIGGLVVFSVSDGCVFVCELDCYVFKVLCLVWCVGVIVFVVRFGCGLVWVCWYNCVYWVFVFYWLLLVCFCRFCYWLDWWFGCWCIFCCFFLGLIGWLCWWLVCFWACFCIFGRLGFGFFLVYGIVFWFCCLVCYCFCWCGWVFWVCWWCYWCFFIGWLVSYWFRL